MRVAVREQALWTPLATNTALLVATEDGLRRRLLEAVDPYAAGLESDGDLLGMLDVLTPHTCTETRVHAVGAVDDFLLVGPGLRRHDGA